MDGHVTPSIRSLRRHLVLARARHSRVLLEEVEEGLRRLAAIRYRCCLLDFTRAETAFYVRLMGYERGRLKAELEFPIRSDLRAVQWLPLSHLADYDEARSRVQIERIGAAVGPYIRRPAVPLARRPPLLLPPGSSQPVARPAVGLAPRADRAVRCWRWIAGGAALLAGAVILVALRLGVAP